MFDPKRYILAGGTVVVALGIGFVMQQSPGANAPSTGKVAATQTASLDTRSDAPSVVQSGLAADLDALDLSGVTHTSANPKPEQAVEKSPETDAAPIDEETEIAAATPVDDETATMSDAQPDPVRESDSCSVEMTATPAPAAMVDLGVSAACLPQARVTIHHNGMMLSYLTDEDGDAEIRVPALSKDAVFIASFENGTGAVARAKISDLADFERVVLQWRGDAGFEIHALENGADYGAQGHVWRDAPGTITRAENAEGGFIAVLGDRSIQDGLRGEVYTYPVSGAEDASVELSAEAVVSEANCTRDIEAQALQISRSGDLSVQDLALTMPSCDVAGDILMLKNLLQDLKIARN